jgi:hypothetical protein
MLLAVTALLHCEFHLCDEHITTFQVPNDDLLNVMLRHCSAKPVHVSSKPAAGTSSAPLTRFDETHDEAQHSVNQTFSRNFAAVHRSWGVWGHTENSSLLRLF